MIKISTIIINIVRTIRNNFGSSLDLRHRFHTPKIHGMTRLSGSSTSSCSCSSSPGSSTTSFTPQAQAHSPQHAPSPAAVDDSYSDASNVPNLPADDGINSRLSALIEMLRDTAVMLIADTNAIREDNPRRQQLCASLEQTLGHIAQVQLWARQRVQGFGGWQAGRQHPATTGRGCG